MHSKDTYQRMAGSEQEVSSQPPYVPDEEYYRQRHTNQPNTKVRLGIALLLVGLVWLAFEFLGRNSIIPVAGSEGILLEETFNGRSIEMNVSSSDVDIRAWDEGNIRIEARYSGGSPSDYTVDIEELSDGIRLNEDIESCFGIGFCSRHLEYEILIPQNGNVNLQTSSGDVIIADTSGEIRLSTASGNVSLDSVQGILDVSTASGDVELESGQITDAQVRTMSGEIELEGVSNNLVLESVSGNITVEDAQDSRLNIQNTSGNFEYTGTLADSEQHRVSSVSGNVEVYLPEDTGLSLQIDTLSGNIENKFGQQETGRDGSTMRIDTLTGNIDLASW